MKRILVGLAAVIVTVWILSGIYALLSTAGDTGNSWEWYHTLMVIPFGVAGTLTVLVILWKIGDTIMGES